MASCLRGRESAHILWLSTFFKVSELWGRLAENPKETTIIDGHLPLILFWLLVLADIYKYWP